MKWLQCWLYHPWSKWSEPYPGEGRWFGGPWVETEIQSRKCNKCNERQLRSAH